MLENLCEAPFRVADLLPTADDPFVADTCAPMVDYLPFRRQASEALRELYAASKEEQAPVIAVTHGGLIKTLLRVAAGSDRICFHIFNAAVVVVEWDEGRWQLVHINLWDHLEPALRTR